MRKDRTILQIIIPFLLLVSLISFCMIKDCSGQVRKDYTDHFLCGSLAGFTGNWTGWVITGCDSEKEKNMSFIAGVGTAAIVGAGKELIYDKWMDKGTPEFNDFLSTTLGGVFGSGVLRLALIGKKEPVILAKGNYKGMRIKI
jgi:hypothetical protein